MIEERVGHVDLLRAMAVVETKVDMLLQSHKQQGDDNREIYSRLNRLEQSRAQVIILALIGGLVLPVLVTVGMDRAFPRVDAAPAAAVSP